jgi:hypothetical protein
MKRLIQSLNLSHIALLGILLLTAARVSPDPDTWWHLNTGKWMIEHGELLRVDLFSYTRLGQSYAAPGWPVQILLYLVYQLGGIGGLNLLTGVVFTLVFYFVNKTLSGSELLKASALILGATVSSLHASARPALFTLLFSAIFLWVLEDFRWGRANRLKLLPPLMIAWANSHGLAVIGLGLVGLYALGMTKVEKRGKRLVIASPPKNLFILIPFLLLAACLNPYGPVMLIYPLQAASAHWKAAQYIQEWQSPDFHRSFVQPFIWLLLLTLAMVGANRKRLALTDFLLVASFAYLGLYSARNVALFGLAAPVVLTRSSTPLAEAWARLSPKCSVAPRPLFRRVSIYLTLGAFTLVGMGRIVQALPNQSNLVELEKAGMIVPAGALDFLKAERPAGRLFNCYNWGGYLQWALPEYALFVDGRADLFQDEIIGQWFQVALVQDGWQEVLDRWDIHVVLIERTWPVAEALKLAGWKLVYQDDFAMIYVR